MFSLSTEAMAVAFYFLKIKGDGEAALKGVKNLRGAYAVDYAALVFGKYDMVVKVSGANPQDIAEFWFDAESKVSGASCEEKHLSSTFPEREK